MSQPRLSTALTVAIALNIAACANSPTTVEQKPLSTSSIENCLVDKGRVKAILSEAHSANAGDLELQNSWYGKDGQPVAAYYTTVTIKIPASLYQSYVDGCGGNYKDEYDMFLAVDSLALEVAMQKYWPFCSVENQFMSTTDQFDVDTLDGTTTITAIIELHKRIESETTAL